MTPAEFATLKNSVQRQAFEDSQLRIIGQALDHNFLLSRQVIELMDIMTFDSGKLEVAKMAHSRTLDKQNYYVVNDAFTFSSSIDDLLAFIGNG